jgi:hypothetical protein
MDQRILNLPRTLGDKKMGFLVSLETGSSNPEGESKSSILGLLNPPKNQRILWRNQEITTNGLESSPPGVLDSREEMRVEGVSFTRVEVKNSETRPSGF